MKNLLKKSLLIAMAGAMAGMPSCNKTVTNVQNEQPNKNGDATISTEKTEDTVLTIAVLNESRDQNDELNIAVDKFNEADNGYKIEFKVYNEDFSMDENIGTFTEEQYQQMEFYMIQDLINHDEIDIVLSGSFMNESKYMNLKQKGAFLDLYPFMENDSEVTKESMNETFLKLNEIDGKLYSLMSFFSVQTLMGESKYVGENENWTFEDFVAGWEKMPENATIAGATTAEDVYYTVLRSNNEQFVDSENAQVHFDSQEYREMLEFCKRFTYNNNEKTDYDYNAPSYVDDLIFYGIMDSRYFSDNFKEGDFDTEHNYTIVGFPSEDGSGAFMQSSGYEFSICANTTEDEQKGAWEFIRTFGTEQWQAENAVKVNEYNINGETFKDYSPELGLCVNNNAFDRVAKAIVNGEYYDGKGSMQGKEYTYDLPTWENVEELKRYISTVKRLETVTDRAIFWIVTEEVMAYFAGERTLDEAVTNIQNRASIWISEQS